MAERPVSKPRVLMARHAPHHVRGHGCRRAHADAAEQSVEEPLRGLVLQAPVVTRSQALRCRRCDNERVRTPTMTTSAEADGGACSITSHHNTSQHIVRRRTASQVASPGRSSAPMVSEPSSPHCMPAGQMSSPASSPLMNSWMRSVHTTATWLNVASGSGATERTTTTSMMPVRASDGSHHCRASHQHRHEDHSLAHTATIRRSSGGQSDSAPRSCARARWADTSTTRRGRRCPGPVRTAPC